ncbi:MAG: hypothetical protein KW804_01325 [Candidatus Doudnabacteria bacterium]|nr:hypothetical protein [Candidatus Doudnabacteria bacterium]
MKTLGKIFIFLVFAAVVSMVYYWQVIHIPITEAPKTINPPNLLTYSNPDYLFEVKYNRQYELIKDSDRQHYFKTGGNVIATIAMPRSLYQKTTFSSGEITFSAKTKSTESDCKVYLTAANTTKSMTESFDMNGTTYYTVQLDGAAAGTHYRTKLYRIWHNSFCYEINLTIGISNIGNYDDSADIKDVTFEEIFPKLEAIANSLTFTEAEIDPSAETGYLMGNVSAGSEEVYDFTQIVVYSEDKKKIVTKHQLDNSGQYYIVLPVGTYYVTYTTVSSAFQPPMKKVLIMSDSQSKVDFTVEK